QRAKTATLPIGLPARPRVVSTLAPRPTLDRERELAALDYRNIAGVDEAGRGPLAGPVVAAAVILPLADELCGLLQLHDSKQITPRTRYRLFEIITREYSF